MGNRFGVFYLVLEICAVISGLTQITHAQELPKPPGPGKTETQIGQSFPPVEMVNEDLKRLQAERLQRVKEANPRASAYILAKKLFEEAKDPISVRDFQSSETLKEATQRDGTQRKVALRDECLAVDKARPNRVYGAAVFRISAIVLVKSAQSPAVLEERVLIFGKERDARWSISPATLESYRNDYYLGSVSYSSGSEIITNVLNPALKRNFRKSAGLLLGKQVSKAGESYFYCQTK